MLRDTLTKSHKSPFRQLKTKSFDFAVKMPYNNQINVPQVASTPREFSVATPSQRGKYHQMKRRLEIELDFITELSPFELASKIEPLLQEAIETVKQTQETELELDIFLILDGREIRFVMEPV